MNDTATRIASPTQLLLEDLLRRSVVLREDWEGQPPGVQEDARRQGSGVDLLHKLVEQKLLTAYQAGCVEAGKTTGLIVGNYRILDRLGKGGMGVVYKAEHLLLRRVVALKVLPNPFEDDLQLLPRFLAEIRSVARLQHPNIVAALDAGRTLGSELEPANLYYFAMEYVPGSDLEQHVLRGGPMAVDRACQAVCQVASALAEAHRHNLVHRDIKPSNVILTPEGQAKLLDFGLARQFHDRRLTQAGAVLGSPDFMAPEQAAGGTVDHRADLYALGGTLCWCLLGKLPFPPRSSFAEDLLARITQQPPQLRASRPDLPAELEQVVAKMMALRVEDRYPTAQAVMSALLPFLKESALPQAHGASETLPAAPRTAEARTHRVLIADDSTTSRRFARLILEQEGLICDEATDGKQALAAAQARPYDLVLLDVNMPHLTGPEVLRRLREQPPGPNLKVILLSGGMSPDEMADLLEAGADDFLPKPPSIPQLVGRVKAALSHKDAQDRSDLLNRHLLAVNSELERSLRAGASDLAQSRNALLVALAELAELRAGQTGAHLERLQRYCRCLAEAAATLPAFAGQIDDNFVDMLEGCAPLHDIGQAALPDHILRKAGKFDHEERLIMQTHTTLGADILQGIARRHRCALALLQMAADIARHHHEAYDGNGYPDRLAGSAIPLAARIVTVADVYDALRSRRPHRPPLAHLLAVELMTEGCPGRFDPHLLGVFQRCAGHFERIFRDMPEQG
jgi:response regulator RpfG family c-di-GMP phosphodiesterase/serine/threonine protein kinase